MSDEDTVQPSSKVGIGQQEKGLKNIYVLFTRISSHTYLQVRGISPNLNWCLGISRLSDDSLGFYSLAGCFLPCFWENVLRTVSASFLYGGRLLLE